jgi:hypothetical protein
VVVRYVTTGLARLSALVAGMAILGAPTVVRSASLPDGIVLGPWIVAPSFSTSYEAEDNVFLEKDDNAVDDQVTTYTGDIRAWLPFSNSRLELGYRASKEDYAESVFPRDTTQFTHVGLELNFKTGDTLSFSDDYRRDFARSDEVDAGEEAAFNGEPYSLNRWQLELSRTDPGRQGYVVRVRRQDFIYEGEEDIGFFEYRGFHNVFEYRQPLPNARSWIMRYESRRFNHYDPEGVVGEPFRKEVTDAVQFGLRGFLGRRQPFRVHLGYGRFRYDGADESRFDGIVGTAAWRLRLGGRTKLDLEAIRRPLPSNFETHYINNAIRADLEREWLRFEVGTELEFVKNDYADVIAGLQCSGRRKDDTYEVDVHWGWRVHERFKFRVSSFHAKRSSTCDSADYSATGIQTGFSIGWF